MAVFKRKTTRGETKSYHYKFYHAGTFYHGICTKCKTKPEAEEFEKRIRKAVKQGREVATGRKQFEKIYEKALQIKKENISLGDAYDRYLKKPRKRKTSEKFIEQKRSYWDDFTAFMSNRFPDVKTLSEIKKNHGEDYIGHVQNEGRYRKEIQLTDDKSYKREGYLLSARTINLMLMSLKEVFKALEYDAGIEENPFNIDKMASERQTREAFTKEELKDIFEKADDFIRPIFSIGICTALREGDICTLRKDEINFNENFIRKTTKKTGAIVEIPIITNSFRNYLLELKKKSGNSKYLLPEHAKMYDENPPGISYRVQHFLEKTVGITTTRAVDGRSRKLSIKDVHSLRHTFCYLAGLQNIPMLIVKAVVGHMSGEMTALYQRHSDMKAKRAELSKMPDFLSVGQYEPKLIVDPGQGGDLKENIRRILSDGKLTAREKKILKLAKG